MKGIKKIQKIISIAARTLLGTFLLLTLLPIPVERHLPAAEVAVSSNGYELIDQALTLHVSGFYNINLWSDDTFDGTLYVDEYEIIINSYDITKNKINLALGKDIRDKGQGLLGYRYETGEYTSGGLPKMSHYLFGSLFTDPTFDVIIIRHGADRGADEQFLERYIVAPSIEPAEALNILGEKRIFTAEQAPYLLY